MIDTNDLTLTRADREAPFKPAPPDAEPLVGPTRVYHDIEETEDAYRFIERVPFTGRPLAVSLLSKGEH